MADSNDARAIQIFTQAWNSGYDDAIAEVIDYLSSLYDMTNSFAEKQLIDSIIANFESN